MINSFKRGIGYQIAKIVVTLVVAFIIALLSGKVHALSWDLDFQKEVKVFDSSKLVSVPVTGSASSTAPLNLAAVNFDHNFTNTDDYDFIVIPISFTIRDKTGTTSQGDFWANIVDSGMRIQLVSNDSWSNCEAQNNFLVCPLIDDLTYSGIRFNFTKAYVDDSSYYITLNSYISLYNSNNSTTAKNTEEINNSIKSDDIGSDNDNSSKVNEWSSSTASNGTITQLITLPLTLYTSILNNINGSCTTFNLGSLYGSNLTMSCVRIQDYVGDTLWSVIDILFSGFFILIISKKMIKVFNNISSMKEGDILD